MDGKRELRNKSLGEDWARTVALLVILAVLAVVDVSHVPAQETRSAELARLHGVLQSDAARLQKIEACKRLAVLGDESSVPVVAQLLADPALSHAARIVLEPMSSPAASAALRAALSSVRGDLATGLVNSLGARREAGAVADLAGLLAGEEADVAAAAALALGRIANEEAIRALSQALKRADASRASAVAQGCLLAVDQCLQDDRQPAAAQLCDAVMQADVPDYIRMSATRGTVRAAQSLDARLLADLLRSGKELEFDMALVLIREFPRADIVAVAAEQLQQLGTPRQVLLLSALADRGDSPALQVVLAATQHADVQVRIAATRGLGRFADESVGLRLLDMLCDANETIAAAALDALVQVPGTSLDTAIVARLQAVPPVARVRLYQVIGERQITAGLDVLCEAADAEQVDERLTALRALGRVIPADRLGVLTDRLKTSSGEELAAVEAALQAACARLGDSEACARQLVDCLPDAADATRLKLIELLGLVGGHTALDAVRQEAAKRDPETLETVTRVLGQWMTPDAAPLLLALAESDLPGKYRVRAVRGYIRILRQFDMTRQQRIDMCVRAMPLAERREERLLMLDALLRVPSAETLRLAAAQLEHPAVRQRACEVALLLSNNLVQTDRQAVVEAMDKVIAVTDDPTFKSYAQQLRAMAK